MFLSAEYLVGWIEVHHGNSWPEVATKTKRKLNFKQAFIILERIFENLLEALRKNYENIYLRRGDGESGYFEEFIKFLSISPTWLNSFSGRGEITINLLRYTNWQAAEEEISSKSFLINSKSETIKPIILIWKSEWRIPFGATVVYKGFHGWGWVPGEISVFSNSKGFKKFLKINEKFIIYWKF